MATDWPADILERMSRAVEAVRERLLRSTAALATAGGPYGVIGANAVAHWVATVDEGAVRNTPNVDILVRSDDAEAARVALEGAGFVRVAAVGPPTVFLDGPAGRPRQAVRLWFCGDVLSPGTEPLPDVVSTLSAAPFRVVSLPTLVRMKLSGYRTIDRVHLRDLARVGLVDATWPDRFPEVLAERLRQILANPDG
jgi:hypothetical protein